MVLSNCLKKYSIEAYKNSQFLSLLDKMKLI